MPTIWQESSVWGEDALYVARKYNKKLQKRQTILLKKFFSVAARPSMNGEVEIPPLSLGVELPSLFVHDV